MRIHSRASQLLFLTLVCLAVLIQIFFLANIIMWRSSPDLGWTPFTELGPKIVGMTTDVGEKAGLRKNDQILELNGENYKTFEELNALTDFGIGQANIYKIKRRAEIFTVSVVNEELGFRKVLIQSGLFWILGIIFIGIGVLVFLMKPYHGPSWAFLGMTSIMGIFVAYSAPSYFFRPSWLDNVMIWVPPFLPAAILHLAALFPQKKDYFADRKWLLISPYLISATLAALSRTLSPDRISNVPAFLMNIIYLYLLLSLVVFLASTIYGYIKSASVAIRLQSLVIFAGVTIALFIPLVELLTNLIFKVSLVPNPIVFYLLFLVFFPLSIGYAIARHDLFEIDTLVRRTYGYILSTGTVVAAYALIVSGLNAAFRGSDISRSPVFSIVFALGIVFFFNPIHRRFQRTVDRVFYRQQYDYRRTIKNLSEAMTSILDADQIHRTLIGSVVREMFLENGLLLLPVREGGEYRAHVSEGIGADRLGSAELVEGSPVLRYFHESDDPILQHDLDLHPLYEKDREILRKTFFSLSSEALIPMKYKDEIKGIISLGRKKSGKMFAQEDLDVLKTLTSQSVIALENARLFQENLVKGRMEEELKIAHDIQVGMLPKRAPEFEGFKIVARSIPAREVGGDFYDFVVIRSGEKGEQLGLLVADVSGKGVSGALVMAASRSICRVLADEYPDVEELMSAGNRRLVKDIKKGMFVALVYALLDPRERMLTLSNAGQTQPILCPGNGSRSFYIETEGDTFPLGIVEESRYLEKNLVLNRGDAVVFYTDGIVEAMNHQDEMYGFERFMSSIEGARLSNPDAMIDKLLEDVALFVDDAEQHDDLTLVILKVE